MSKFFVVISLFSLGLIAGCSSYDPVTPAPVVVAPTAPVVTAPVATPPGTVAVVPAATSGPAVVVPTALRPGNGRVESITTVASAAAGATGSSANSLQRVAIRMDDGTVQVVDTRATGLAVGDRVELTRDGMIRH
jgi:hypothetical protein